MKIDVLFFAQMSDAMKTDREALELPEGALARDAVAILRARPEWAPVSGLPLVFAVNETVVGGDHPLRDGDRLALLTPVSGG